ncbi:MAG TPA: metal-sulfur cluster assembly factor [Fibrobacteraceae bacterium]|nr:metal-sulfur cluster assembly factor [Fibrobacteraceae bacterium]
MRLEYVLLNFAFPFVVAVSLYLASAFLARRGILDKGVHRMVWNTALLLLFVACGVTGFLLAWKMYLNNIHLVVRLHHQTGAGMLAVAAGHTLERLSWFTTQIRNLCSKRRKQTLGMPAQWLRVLGALLVMTAIIFLPGKLVNLTADRRVEEAKAAVARLRTQTNVLPQDSSSIPLVPKRKTIPPPPPASAAAKPVIPPKKTPVKAVTPTPAKATAPSSTITRDELGRILALKREQISNNGIHSTAEFENRSDISLQRLEQELREVWDPEISINIYDLGLIRKVQVDEKKNLNIDMLFTSPTCPHNEWLQNRLHEQMEKSSLFASVNIHILKGKAWMPEFVSPEGNRILTELERW